MKSKKNLVCWITMWSLPMEIEYCYCLIKIIWRICFKLSKMFWPIKNYKGWKQLNSKTDKKEWESKLLFSGGITKIKSFSHLKQDKYFFLKK
jgi:hypothetical protein